MATGSRHADGGEARAYAGFAVAVLFFANLVGYLDRQILTLLVNPVKTSLGLSDGEIGLMQGPAFVITFVVAGLFAGRLLDRHNRRNLLVACVAIWTLSAAAGGLAQNGMQLFIARMGVGIGEAALIPAGISLISDYFGERTRGRAYGIFTSGIYAGSGMSLVLVAAILPLVTNLSLDAAQAGLNLEPWRMVMLSMLVPGALCCILLMLMREPARTTVAGEASAGDRAAGWSDWRERAGWFVPHHLCLSFANFGLYSIAAWLPSVLIREHGIDPRMVGLSLGVVVALAGGISATAGGALSDAMAAKAGSRGRMMLALFCCVAGMAGYAIVLAVPSVAFAIVGGGVVTAGLCIVLVSGIMAMAEQSPGRSRAFISAIYFVFSSIIGTAGGPAVIGYLNDFVGSETIRLSHILGGCGLVACALACLFGVAAVRGVQAPGRQVQTA
jgi:MFS family permease